MPRAFLAFQPGLNKFSKQDVDKGHVTPAMASTCNILRATFFLSNGFRRERELFLQFPELDMMVRFHGPTLRYLGPDERSMLLLLEKALDIHEAREKVAVSRWQETTPGILTRGMAGETKQVLATTMEAARCKEACMLTFNYRFKGTLACFQFDHDMVRAIISTSMLWIITSTIPSGKAGKSQDGLANTHQVTCNGNGKCDFDACEQITLINLIEDTCKGEMS